jgi:hypothetical protein
LELCSAICLVAAVSATQTGPTLPWQLQTFDDIAKRAGQGKINFRLVFVFFRINTKHFQGSGQRNRGSMDETSLKANTTVFAKVG